MESWPDVRKGWNLTENADRLGALAKWVFSKIVVPQNGGETLLKWMIWVENHLFLETPKVKFSDIQTKDQ